MDGSVAVAAAVDGAALAEDGRPVAAPAEKVEARRADEDDLMLPAAVPEALEEEEEARADAARERRAAEARAARRASLFVSIVTPGYSVINLLTSLSLATLLLTRDFLNE